MNQMMQQINNLSDKLAQYNEQIKAATDRVINSGRFILGSELKKIEQSFASYLGAMDCVRVANGTDAIELALRAMEIQAGDTVATVANAGMYTTSALMAIVAKPFFMDVNLDTRCASQ